MDLKKHIFGGGFSSIEDYLNFQKENNNSRFRGSEIFYKLFKIEELKIMPDFTSVRTMYNRGGACAHYFITEDKMLEGMTGGNAHNGISGIHDPKELLSIENAPDGWELNNYFWRPKIN